MGYHARSVFEFYDHDDKRYSHLRRIDAHRSIYHCGWATTSFYYILFIINGLVKSLAGTNDTRVALSKFERVISAQILCKNVTVAFLSLFFFYFILFVFKFYLRINYIHACFKNLSSRVYEMRIKLVKKFSKIFFASINSIVCKISFKQKYNLVNNCTIMIIRDHTAIKHYVVLYDNEILMYFLLLHYIFRKYIIK